MTPGARATAVASATVGTALLAGSFVLMVRAERVGEALSLAAFVALGQTVALHAVLLLLLGRGGVSPLAVVRHLFALAVLDGLTLVAATLVGHWFPQRPRSR